MDTSYINWVSKELNWFDEYPCCEATENIGFEALPSSLRYAEVVDGLPCFNPSNDLSFVPHDSLDGWDRAQANHDEFSKSLPYRPRQVKALDRFKLIHATVVRNLNRDGISMSDLKQYAACFDEFMFDGKLIERCSIEWAAELEPRMCLGEKEPQETTGVACFGHVCRKHQQCHTIRIQLARDFGYVKEKRSTRRGRLARLHATLSILLHEMSHAWVEIFLSKKYRQISHALDELGPFGHGKAWKNVFRMCLWTASEQFGLKLKDAVYDDDNDARTISAIEYLAETFLADCASRALNTEAFLHNMSLKLEVSIEQAGFFQTLVESGLDLQEALTTIAGSDLTNVIKPSLDIHEILPSEWQWKG